MASRGAARESVMTILASFLHCTLFGYLYTGESIDKNDEMKRVRLIGLCRVPFAAGVPRVCLRTTRPTRSHLSGLSVSHEYSSTVYTQLRSHLSLRLSQSRHPEPDPPSDTPGVTRRLCLWRARGPARPPRVLMVCDRSVTACLRASRSLRLPTLSHARRWMFLGHDHQ